MPKVPIWLDQDRFIQRVNERSARRGYGSELTPTLLQSWTDNGLIEPKHRLPNAGKHPNYAFGAPHYRRALQLVRLRRRWKARAALMVALAVRGYGVAPNSVREDLVREWRRSKRRLNAPIRSIHADRIGPIAEEHRRAFLNQFGELAPQLSNFRLPANIYIWAVRTMRRPYDPLANGPNQSLLAGILVSLNEHESGGKPMDMFEDAVFNASGNVLESAFQMVRPIFFTKNSMNWASGLLVLSTFLLHNPHALTHALRLFGDICDEWSSAASG